MHKAVIFIDKYSDWLEAYSALKATPVQQLTIYTFNNGKTEEDILMPIFREFMPKDTVISYIQSESFLSMVESIKDELFTDKNVVLFAAPLVRYRHLWALVPQCRKHNIETVHISECLPDTFGPVKYRIAFRGKKLKSWLTIPFAAIYALTHKPDKCYFPLYPYVSNPFVKKTCEVLTPVLLPEKLEIIKNLTGGEKRILLVGGFGYDVAKMAAHLKVDKYIATSKGMEIIIDGTVYPLKEKICAEEVLFSGAVSSIAGYFSSAIIWARLKFPDMKIICYEATAFNRQYGNYYSALSKKALKKMGVTLLPECKEMLS